jgi:hypothetical protein
MPNDVEQRSEQLKRIRTSSAAETAAKKRVAKTGAGESTPAYIVWTVVLISVMVGKVSDWVPGLSIVPLVKIAYVVAAISAYGRHGAALAPVRIRSSRITRATLAFLTLGIVSFVFSIYKSATVAVSLYILILMLAFMLIMKVTRTLRDVERLMLGFAAAGVSLSAGLVLNFHGGRAFINGNFDPNDIALALDTILPIVLALRPRHSRWRSLLAGALAFTIVVSVLLTGSRGGTIGLAVVIAALVAFPLGLDQGGALIKFSIGKTLTRCALLGLVSVLVWGHLPAETQQRMATLLNLGSDYNANADENGSRLLIWKQDLGMVWKRPIGYGMGSAELVDGLAGGQYRTAHNSFLQALVELGVIGLLIFLRALYTMWRELGRVAVLSSRSALDEDAQKAALYARAIRTALAGNLAAGMFLSQAYGAPLWMLVAIAATLVKTTITETDSNAPGLPKKSRITNRRNEDYDMGAAKRR